MNTLRAPLFVAAFGLLFACDLSPADDDEMSAETSSGSETSPSSSSSSTGTPTMPEETSAESSGSTGSAESGSSESGAATGSTGPDIDAPPELAITQPMMDLLGDAGLTYDDFDMDLGLWYVDAELVATANDAEDGDLAASVEWTTDQDGVQDAALGSGGSLTVRLYSDECTGTLHTITATVTDSGGNEVSVERMLNIWTLC